MKKSATSPYVKEFCNRLFAFLYYPKVQKINNKFAAEKPNSTNRRKTQFNKMKKALSQ